MKKICTTNKEPIIMARRKHNSKLNKNKNKLELQIIITTEK
ncbi:hypothetical protein DOY81_001904 [Sarcophaga bullata]|nr:hypothetical protein DOY81_001904 [Sarcophaga bullata]